MNSLYECGCDKCKAERKINLESGKENPLFKKVLKAAENAFNHLHSKGSYKPEDITDKPYQKLIDETYKVFNSVITDNEIPPEMLAGLQSDAFLFGGLKTHAQLTEASTMLLETGKVKSFQQLQNEFQKLNTTYNQNYLEAEYQFAVNSSQMAANWAGLDDSGRYNLQYRTAGDNRVRQEHAALQGITLPKEDDFWLSYYPPNGWRCRCQVVEVRKSKFEESDSEKSIQKGQQATSQIGKDGKNKLEIFRFNPGKEEKLFPPKHPYKKVKGADEVKRIAADLEKEIDYKVLHKSEIFAGNLADLSDEMKNAFPGVDVEKINAINMYSGYFYSEINNFNRGLLGKVELLPKHGITEDFYQKLTKTINNGLDEIPDKFKGTTYRGTDLTREQMQPYFDALKTGKDYVENTFMSSSYKEYEAFDGNVNFVIESKNGAMIEKISEKPFEKEVLFKAGQKFKVKKIDEFDGDVWHVYLEQL